MQTEKQHRQRLKERFQNEGLDHFDPVHALELLLFYAIPRIDTKPVARQLIDRFGSFYGVLEASREELMSVPGIGENAALFLRLVRESSRYYTVDRSKMTKVFQTVKEYGAYLSSLFVGRCNETMFMLCLDAKGKMLCCRQLGEGDVVSANLPFRKVVEIALQVNAASVILAHNHPSGLAVPSREDVAVTMQLAQILETMNIQLIDHVIAAEDEYISLMDSGYLR